MAAAQAGHAPSYRLLLAELNGWLVRMFARRLPMAEVEDAVQEALIAVQNCHRPITGPRQDQHPSRAAQAADPHGRRNTYPCLLNDIQPAESNPHATCSSHS
jgi:hypothetical protein